DVQRPYPDRFRGILALAYEQDTGEEACIGCRLCEYVCPPQVIKVEMLKGEKRNYAKTFTLELYACEFCELCVQVCPTDAIIMMRSFDLAPADRRELLLDKDRLHALGLQFEPSWATGNRLRDMQAPPKPAREARGEAKGEAKEPAECPSNRLFSGWWRWCSSPRAWPSCSRRTSSTPSSTLRRRSSRPP